MSSTTVPAVQGFTTGPIRDVGFPLIAAAATLFLPFQWIVWLYLIVGHAHFLMTYLYQYRAKKINGLYLAVALLTLAGTLWYMFVVRDVLPFFVTSGILFAVHFAIDEFTLHSEHPSWISAITLAGFALLFSSLIFLVAFPGFSWLPFVAGGIAALAVISRLLMKSVISAAERYLWFVALLLFVLAIFFGLPQSILGVILLLHFANWYIGYGNRLKGRPERARSYWIEVAVTLLICAILFGLFMFGRASWLTVLFAPFAYYAWALAHILLSFVASFPRRT